MTKFADTAGQLRSALQHHERLQAVAFVYSTGAGKWFWTHLGRISAKSLPELPTII